MLGGKLLQVDHILIINVNKCSTCVNLNQCWQQTMVQYLLLDYATQENCANLPKDKTVIKVENWLGIIFHIKAICVEM